MAKKGSAEDTIRDIKHKTRRKYSAEEKVRIVMEGLRGEMTVAGLCRREGIAQSLYYKWSKEFLEAGKARPNGGTKRQATSHEVKDLQTENEQLKQKPARSLDLKVSQKGAVSLYGLGRFPVTLYKEQWERVLEMADEIRAFITQHDSELKKKGD